MAFNFGQVDVSVMKILQKGGKAARLVRVRRFCEQRGFVISAGMIFKIPAHDDEARVVVFGVFDIVKQNRQLGLPGSNV